MRKVRDLTSGEISFLLGLSGSGGDTDDYLLRIGAFELEDEDYSCKNCANFEYKCQSKKEKKQ